MLDELTHILFMAVVGIGLCVWDTNGVNQIPNAPPLPQVQRVLPAPVGARLDFNNIFNLNENIPEYFQPKTHAVQINGAPNIRCVYFAIPANGVVNNARFHVALHQQPNLNDHNIYFSTDGHQPTTQEAVAWSCANIDNRENSPITEWYMKMFGVIPFQNTGNPANDYIKAGWDNSAVPNAKAIIIFDTICNGGIIITVLRLTILISLMTQIFLVHEFLE